MDESGTPTTDAEAAKAGSLFVVMPGPRRDLSGFLDAIRRMEPADGFDAVLIPGERGRQCREQRMRDGVPMADEVYDALLCLAGVSAAAWQEARRDSPCHYSDPFVRPGMSYSVPDSVRRSPGTPPQPEGARLW